MSAEPTPRPRHSRATAMLTSPYPCRLTSTFIDPSIAESARATDVASTVQHVSQDVKDAGRDADLRHVEAPRLDQTEGVVDIAPDAVTERLVEHLPSHLLLLGTRHYSPVSFGELHLAQSPARADVQRPPGC